MKTELNPGNVLLFGVMILVVAVGPVLFAASTDSAPQRQPSAAEGAKGRYAPTADPDRIILTWSGDPATTQAVTWRTDTSVARAVAEVAVADASPKFHERAKQFRAHTRPLVTENGPARHHSVNFTDLTPKTHYAYRVGDGERWSEWFQFRTASDQPEPFTFLYFGDAQNGLRSVWSRTIRAAYASAPDARFILHAGDLVNRAQRDTQWGAWFEAGGWINGMVPSIPVAGNHDYTRTDGNRITRRLHGSYTAHWRSQFTLPENGPEHLEETAYYTDFQGTRIIVLNSEDLGRREEQARWMERVLADNPNRWTIVASHRPMFAVAPERETPALHEHWKPVFDRYGVDLVLQGHDHVYGRGRAARLATDGNERGPMYVVSVSGSKMYGIKKPWMERAGEDVQLYQVVHVEHDRLRFEARLVTGELYDAFDLVKQADGTNRLVNRLVDEPERRRPVRTQSVR